MAIDSKTKRLSLIAFGDGTGIHTLPEPDNSIDQGDRQHFLDLYGGLLAGGQVVTGTAALSFNQFTIAATGAEEFTGSAALSVDQFTITAVGAEIFTGSAALSHDNFSISGSGAEEFIGSAALVHNNFTITASGEVAGLVFTGTAALVHDNLSISASGTVVNPVTATVSVAGWDRSKEKDMERWLAQFDVDGRASLTLPLPTIRATGHVQPPVVGSAALITHPFAIQAVGSVDLVTAALKRIGELEEALARARSDADGKIDRTGRDADDVETLNLILSLIDD